MTTVEEKYDFSAKAKKNLLITVGIGIALTDSRYCFNEHGRTS